MRRPAVLALLALAAAASGCGDDDESRRAADARPVQIEMRNLRFDPERVRVQAGQTIRWTNDESIQHNVVAQEGADFKSDLLDEDQTFQVTPEDAGTIRYRCTLHPGMTGTIVVGD